MPYANALNILPNPNGDRAVTSGTPGVKLVESNTTSAEIEYLQGVTSFIQQQLDSKSNIIIDTQSNILSSPSPSIGQFGAATDTLQLLFFNGSEWQIAA